MATTDKTIITAAGRNMLVDLDNNNAHANGFNIYFSTGDLTGMTDDQLVNLQDIQSKDIKVPATVIHLDQGDTRIRAEATYNGPQKGIYINTYATYAVDANGNELLFAIYLNSEPQYLLASTTSQDTTQGYGFNIGISQTDNVNFTKLADNVATLQDVKTMIDGGDAVTIHGDQTIIGNKNFTGNVQVNGKDVVSTDQLTQAISNFSGDDKDHNFTAKLQHNGVDVVDSNELNNAISNFSGDDKSHNFTTDLQYKGNEVATINDTNNAYQNAVNTSKNYTDSSHILGMPTSAIQKGESFDNYIGQYVHKDIDGLNLSTDVLANSGLPNQICWGELISIPNHNTTTQIINDNLGNSWRRISKSAWSQVLTASNGGIVSNASIPSWVPAGTQFITSPTDMNTFAQIGTFYTPNASNFVNAPSQMPTSGGAFLCTQWTINGVCFTENIYTDNPAFKASRNCTTRNAYDTTAFNYNWNYGGNGTSYNNTWGSGFDPNFKPSYIN